MTLAIILFVSILSASAPPVTGSPQATEQSPPAAKSVSGGAQDNTTAQTPTKSTSSAQAQTPSNQKPAAAVHPRRKKKRIASNCVPASAVGSATAPPTSASPTAPPPDASTNGATPTPQTATAPTVCPPPKVIVRQGGTSEPSIQLDGGATGDQAAQQRRTANQMLVYTQTNLKKMAGRQLTPNQQDMVNQIHQFMDQAKTAVAAGDVERARTLAWKAQLLSEELVNPQK